MRSISLDQIIISPNRQRQEFEPQALMELTESIADRGLMHAPILRPVGEHWMLVSGERRLRALKDVWALGGKLIYDGVEFEEGVTPFVSLGDLNELEAEEAELDENLKRKDLTWQEHAAALQRLHTLRVKQSPAHTVAATAQEVRGRSDGSNQEVVRQEIIVARHLNNPDIAKAKNVKEAFKILKRQEEVRKNADLALAVGKTFSADDHILLNVNCLEYMNGREAEFDVILTDPPYGMGADDFGDGGGKLTGIAHDYDDSLDSWRILMGSWAVSAFRVAKPQAHAYVFCDFDRFHELKSYMAGAGWYVFRTPLVVYKLNSGRVPLPDRGPRRQYELCLYAIKGDKPVNQIYPDVIPCTADENMSHGAQKPVALYENLLQRSVRPGDKVADFFCGTGPIFEAAHKFKCYAVGTELSPDSYGMAMARLRRMKENENLELVL